MENKYITVAYRLYAIADGKKELLEEATVEHPFQFISGIGYTLDKFEKEITALSKGDNFNFTIPCAEANVTKTMYVRYQRKCSVIRTETSTAKTFSQETSLC